MPVGGMIAGLLIPFLIITVNWQTALYVIAALSFFFAAVMQPFRTEFDSDRNPGASTSLRGLLRNVQVFHSRPLCTLGLTSLAFIGIQMAFATFFVSFLVKGLGHDIETAGLIFSAGQISAVGFRILWGWISDRFLPARRVLSILGFCTAASACAVASFTPDMPIWMLVAINIVFTSTAYSWNGVLWAEVARNAPPGRVGALTGPVVSFAYVGSTLFPGLSAALLAATDSFAVLFVVSAAPALVMATVLLFRPWASGQGRV
ncbi:MAG: MFS transporter [Alphaproteobacteria bacterium]